MPDVTSQLRVLCVGAHPDDCEIKFGGTAAKFAAAGHAVKFLSVTNGDAGHADLSGEALADVRANEAHEAACRLGIAESEVLPNRDGALVPSVAARNEIVQQIREWKADLVLTHRPYDYHPDHRYTAQLVQDSAYLVLVPNICPSVEPLPRNPVFMYLQDEFRKPAPFLPDIVVDIDCAWDRKLDALDAHVSQFYEWLPWIEGKSAEVPQDEKSRRSWLADEWTRPVAPEVRWALERRYGRSKGQSVKRAESFELCEYGRHPCPQELERMFPR